MITGGGENLGLETGKPRFFYGYAVVVAAFIVMLVAQGAFLSFGVFFKPVLTDFGWTRAMTSGAFSLCFLLNGLLGIGMGMLNDRRGPRLVVTTCGILLGAGYLLMSQINTIWQLYLFYGVIVGIGLSGAWVPLLSTVSRWFVKRRALMCGIVLSGVGIGIVIIPPLAAWLISIYSWRTSYIIVGIIVLVLVILAAQFLRRDPSQVGQLPYGAIEVEAESSSLEATGFSLHEAIHTTQFWLLCAINFFLLFCELTIMVHIAPHATDLGISATVAATILAIIGGVSIAGTLIMGGIADRIGSRLALTIGVILMAVPLFGLLLAKEVWMLYLVAAVFGFAWGATGPLTSPIVAELFGLRSHGTIFGIINFCCTIGGAIGPVLAGMIFDVKGSYNPAFLICAALATTSCILALLLRPTAVKEEVKYG